MANLRGSGGAIIFVAMAIIGILLIIYSFRGEGTTPSEKLARPTEEIIPKQISTLAPTGRPTITIATVAIGGDEPPPLPPG